MGQDDMISRLHTSSELVELGLGLYVIGYAIGPLFLAPFSEFVGRYQVYVVTYFICKLIYLIRHLIS